MAKNAPVKTPDPLAAIADELGLLEKELGPWKPKLARAEMLRKALRAACDERPVEHDCHVEGARFIAWLGAKPNVRTVNAVKLLKLITARAFASLATCTLTALEENSIDPAVIAQVVESAPTGCRPLTIFEKGTFEKGAA